jgi:hypothetical protein
VPAWHEIGPLKGAADSYSEIVGFAGGYIVLGDRAIVLYSPDGQTWTSVTVPFPVSKDPHGIPLEAGAYAIATDGRGVVVVGSYGHVPCTPANDTSGGGPECPSSPISWESTDGKTWRSSYPWRGPATPRGYTQGSGFSSVWAVPTGGWDAAIGYVAGEAGAAGGIFHSADGVTWAALPSAPPTALRGSPAPPQGWHLGLADQTGRRLVAGYWYLVNRDLVARLFTSSDGQKWMTLDKFPGAGANVDAGVPPVPDRSSSWILAGKDSASLPTVWTSADLAAWSTHSLPTASPDAHGSLSAIAVTHLGYVALAKLADGPDVLVGYHTSWVSADGIDWVQLATPGAVGDDGPDVVADGQDGVIGISFGRNSNVGPVIWMLR